MKVDVLYITDCPHYLPALELLAKILREEGITAEVRAIHVEDASAARLLRMVVSPTIRIDGIDVDPCGDDIAEPGERGIACSWYPNGHDLPLEAKIRARLKEGQPR